MTSSLVARRDSLRVGVISDVHAHPIALERALDLLRRVGADRVVCLGDVVEKGPDPNAVIRMLEQALIPTVRGNHDHNALRHAELDPGRGGLSHASLAWLAQLPPRRDYAWAGRYITLSHASLGNDADGVRPGLVPRRMRRALRDCDGDVILLGHTHVPMCMRFDGRWLCNPGSVVHGRSGHGATCGVLCLPSMTFEVHCLHTGQRVGIDTLE